MHFQDLNFFHHICLIHLFERGEKQAEIRNILFGKHLTLKKKLIIVRHQTCGSFLIAKKTQMIKKLTL